MNINKVINTLASAWSGLEEPLNPIRAKEALANVQAMYQELISERNNQSAIDIINKFVSYIPVPSDFDGDELNSVVFPSGILSTEHRTMTPFAVITAKHQDSVVNIAENIRAGATNMSDKGYVENQTLWPTSPERQKMIDDMISNPELYRISFVSPYGNSVSEAEQRCDNIMERHQVNMIQHLSMNSRSLSGGIYEQTGPSILDENNLGTDRPDHKLDTILVDGVQLKIPTLMSVRQPTPDPMYQWTAKDKADFYKKVKRNIEQGRNQAILTAKTPEEKQALIEQDLSTLVSPNDRFLSADELENKYNHNSTTGDEHPTWPRQAWRATIMRRMSDFGYWEWVRERLQDDE